jgi:hypothetical protein
MSESDLGICSYVLTSCSVVANSLHISINIIIFSLFVLILQYFRVMQSTLVMCAAYTDDSFCQKNLVITLRTNSS